MNEASFYCCVIDSIKKYDAIHELFLKAEVLKKITSNHEQLESVVVSREKIGSTGFGNGVAVAHGKSELVNGFAIILGISKSGIEFDAIDGKPVKFLFMILHPPKMEKIYLHVLSQLVRQIKELQYKDCPVSVIKASLHQCLELL